MAQRVKNLPAMQEPQDQSLGEEGPLEGDMATHPSILTWKIPWTEEPGGLQSKGSQRVGHDWATKHIIIIRPQNWAIDICKALFFVPLGRPSQEDMHVTLLPGHSVKAYQSQRVTRGGRELRWKESTLITLWCLDLVKPEVYTRVSQLYEPVSSPFFF